jgi:hypothetical protein
MMATRAGWDAETIVQKASELADKDGLGALSMVTLASSLGVRPPHSTTTLPDWQGCGDTFPAADAES